ncbi:MAG: winged helix DNA-binding domain-containing protein [Opitutus sp.]|nr:winged helix DNA-binding domain-containing protein [Opitutus sp.]
MPPALHVSPLAARRFARARLLLDQPAPDVATALAHHGFVQIDPINVCGRMHDLILRNRVAGYREGDLMRHLHGSADAPLPPPQRTAFEHHLPGYNTLVAFPLEAWPHLLAAMKQRTRVTSAWSGRLTPREKQLAEHILEEIAHRGPLSSDDIADDRRGRRVWGASTLAKTTLQKLFFHGRVLISHRVNQRRVYNLPERILPAEILAQPTPPPSDTARWLATLKLRQRRLALLKRNELSQVTDLVQPVVIDGCPTLHCLREDAPLLAACEASGEIENRKSKIENRDSKIARPLLLAPLDPLIYDRRVTQALWDFDYTWEVYTPPAKRVRGYYALPILAGTELVGHVDPKADRAAGKLQIVSRRVRRGIATKPAETELARFLGLKSKR